MSVFNKNQGQKKPNKSMLSSTVSRQPLGLMALEPRILLDAAGVVTGAEGAIDALGQLQADEAVSNLFQPAAFEAPGDDSRGYNEALLTARLTDNIALLQSLNAEQVTTLTAQETDALRGVLAIDKPTVQDTDTSVETIELPEGVVTVTTTGPEPLPFDLEFTNPYPADDGEAVAEKPVIYEPFAIENTVTGKPIVSENVQVNEAVIPEALNTQKPIVYKDITSLDVLNELEVVTALTGTSPNDGTPAPETIVRHVIDLLPEGQVVEDSPVSDFVIPGLVQEFTPLPFALAQFDLQIPLPVDFVSQHYFGNQNFNFANIDYSAWANDFQDIALLEQVPSSVSIVFVDTTVADYQTILGTLDPNVEVVLIGPREDGIEAMARYLEGRTNIATINIISHGQGGTFNLGTSRVNSGAISGRYADELALIGQALSASGDILIYGCNFGQDAAALMALAQATGADIAASDDDTGSAELGGDWDLEVKIGEIEALDLAAPEWNGLLAPLTISITAFPITGGGTGVGAFGVWENAGTVGGTAIDIRATVISADVGASIIFDSDIGTFGGVTFDDMWLRVTGGDVVVRWEIFAAGTNQTVIAVGSPDFRIADIDGNGATTLPFPQVEVEAVAPSLNGLTSYTVDTVTNLDVGIDAGRLLVRGTENQGGEPSSLVAFSWSEVSSWEVTYTATPGFGERFFFHDGDGDFTFNNPNTTFMLSVDSDGDDSTTAGANYLGGFTENSGGTAIVDIDIDIVQDPALGTDIHQAAITLTNPQAGDEYLINGVAVSAGDTGVVGGFNYTVTDTGAELVITLTGTGTTAQYEAALQLITFNNTSENPDTTNRVFDISVTNTTFGTTSNVAISTIAVTALNDAPTAVDDGVFTTTPNTVITISVDGVILANDSDPDGDTLVIDSFTQPAHGTVTCDTGGATASFTGLSTAGGGVSSLPVAANIIASVIDPGDSIVASSDFLGINNNIFNGNGGGEEIRFSFGAVTGTGETAFIAAADQQLVNNVSLTGFDTGSGNDEYTWTAYRDGVVVGTGTIISPDVTGAFATGPISVAGGYDTIDLHMTTGAFKIGALVYDADLNGSGCVDFIYTPDPGYVGTDSWTYTVSDGNGGFSTATVNVEIVNSAPIAEDDDLSGDEDTVSTGSVFSDNGNGADSDADGDAFTVTEVNGALANVGASTAGDNGGTFTINSDGSYSFDPNGDFEGLAVGETRDTTITYTIDDGNGGTDTATVTFTITGVNDAPIAQPDSETTDEDTGFSDSVLVDNGNGVDADPDTSDTLTVTQVNGANIVSGAEITLPSGALLTMNADGTYDYDPNGQFEGLNAGDTDTDTFTYQISDGNGGFDTATVTITINGVADAPTLTNDGDGSSGAPVTDYEDTYTENGLGISLVDSDALVTDADDDIVELVVTLTNGQIGDTINFPSMLPGNITATAVPSTTLGAAGTIVLTFTGDASTTNADWNALLQALNFLPSITDAHSPDPSDRNFTFQVSDSQGNLSNLTNTIIHVVPENDPPTLDLDDDNSSGTNAGNYTGTFTEDAGPVAIHSGILLTDLDDTNLESAQVVLTNPQIDDQMLVNGVVVSAGDTGTVNGIAYTVTTNGSGELVIDLVGTATLADYDTALELITFNNTSDDPDTAQRVITVTVNDGDNDSPTRMAFINVVPVNDPPVLDIALADQATTDGNTTFSMPTAGNFSDPDDTVLVYSLAPGAPAWITIDPATGVVSTTGVPADASQNTNIGGGADGTYDITVVVTDPDGLSAQDTFQLNVINLDPVAVDDVSTGDEDVTQTGNVITDGVTGDADSPPDSDALTVTAVSGGMVGVLQNLTYGDLTLNFDGSWTFVPNAAANALAAGETAQEMITYTIDDGNGGTDTATLTINITGQNDAPVPVDPITGLPPVDPTDYIPAQTGDDSDPMADLDLTPFFTDPDASDTLTISVDPADLPPGLSFDPLTGIISGTPDSSASQGGPLGDGVYTIPVTVSDGNGGTFTTDVIYTISNPAPIAQDDAVNGDEDNVSTGDLFADNGSGVDADPDGDTFVVSEVNGVPADVGMPIAGDNGGEFTIDPDGTYSFDPSGDFDDLAVGETRDTTITYTIDDGEGGTSTATVTLTVGGVNDAPEPVNPLTGLPPADPTDYIPAQIGDDSDPMADLDLTPYFTDPDSSDILTISVDPADLPPGLSFDPLTGIISGTPDSSASQGGPLGDGVYTIPVTVSDGNGGTFTTDVIYTISNPAPIAQDDAVTGDEDTISTGDLFADNGNGVDADPDGDTFVVSEVNGVPANVGMPIAGNAGGEFTINPDGTYSFDPNGDFDDLAVGETRDTTITYTIDDGEGGTSTATVTLTVGGVNDAPEPVDPITGLPPTDPADYIPAQTGDDSDPMADLNLTPFFTDPDASDTLTISVDPADLPPGMSFDPLTGIISGTPDSSASQGGPLGDGVYTIPVTVSDGNGGTFTTDVVYTISNPAPIAQDDAVTGNEDTISTGDLFADNGNGVDADPDGDTFVVSEVNGVPANVGTPTTGNNGGEFTINPDGTYSFDPNGDFEGLDVGETATTTITYTIDDGEGGTSTATVTVTVTGVNDAPIVTGTLTGQTGSDSVGQVPFDASTVFSDPDVETLTFGSPDLPSWMSIDPVTGIITGTPPADASQGGPNNDGVYTVTVTATDPDGETVSTTVTYTFINPPPVVDVPVGPQAAEDSETISIPVDFSDPDGDTLSYSATGLPASLSIDPVTGEITGTLDPSDSQGGPNGDGVYTITVTADDGEGGTVTDTFEFTVTNPAPIAQDDAVTGDEDTVSTGDLFADNGNGVDLDPDGDSFVVSEINGVPANVGTPTAGDTGGEFTINPDGSYSFDPSGDFDDLAVGETRDTIITYTIDDGEGGTSTATVTVTVAGVNDAPEPIDPVTGLPPADPTDYLPAQIGDDSDPVDELDLTPFFTDPDTSDTLTISVDPADLPPGLIFDPFTGIISGTPDPDASQGGPNGDGVYTLPVTVDDGNGGTFTTNVTYVISNPAPIAVDDGPIDITEDEALVLDVIGNDNDPDGDDIMITEINGQPIVPGGGVTLPSGSIVTLNPDGTLEYDPAPNLNGPDIFEYTITDADGASDTASVDVNILPVNDMPEVAADLPDQLSEDGETIDPIDVSGDFSDIDGDPLTFTVTGLPPGLSIDPDTGVITGTLEPGASAGGPYTVTVTATDPDGDSISTDFVWEVVNVPPVVAEPIGPQSGVDGLPVTIPTADNFDDPDGDDLTFTVTGLPEGLTIDPVTGVITGTLPSDSSVDGPYTVTVTVTDEQGDSVSETFVLDVTNPAPTIDELPPAGINVGEQFTLDVGVVTNDPDADPLTFTATGLPPGLTIDPLTGVISGTPTVPADGPYIVVITASDGQGGIGTQTLELIVNEDPYVPEIGGPDILPLGKDVIGKGKSVDAFNNGMPEDGLINLRKVFEEREKDQTLADVLDENNYRLRGGMAMSATLQGMADGAHVLVEAVAHNNSIFVTMNETISALTNANVTRWNVDMSGGALPGWVDYAFGQNFIILNRSIADETVTLRITAVLDNGRRVSGNFEIDMRSGEVELVGSMSTNSLTLSDQFTQIADAERSKDKALLEALSG